MTKKKDVFFRGGIYQGYRKGAGTFQGFVPQDPTAPQRKSRKGK
jgi:hypothetical protein